MILNFLENSTDYISIVIGETYGISVILLTIFSIISTYINNKIMGFSPIVLNRYKLITLFSPLLIHTLFVFAIQVFPFLNNIYVALVESLFLIIYILVLAYYVLQPFYNKDKFKETILNEKIKDFNFKCKDNSKEIVPFVEEEASQLDKYFSEESEASTISITKNDIKTYFTMLFNEIILNKLDDAKILDIISILEKYIIDDYRDLENFDVSDDVKIEYMFKCLDKGNNEKLYRDIFDKLYTMYFKTSEKKYINELMNVTWNNSSNITFLVNILFDGKWNSADVEYLSIYFKIIYLKYMILDFDLNSDTDDKINYFLNCFETNKFNKKYGADVDDFLNTLCIYLRKEVKKNEILFIKK